MKIIVLLSACAALAVPAFAFGEAPEATKTASATQKPAASAAPGKPDKRICKVTVVTGSRLGGKRICMNESDWNAISANSRDTVQTMQKNVGLSASH